MPVDIKFEENNQDGGIDFQVANVNYGEDSTYKWSTGFAATGVSIYGAFTVDSWEALTILVFAIVKDEFSPEYRGTGRLLNHMAGYNWYQYFVKGNTSTAVLAGSAAAGAKDASVLLENITKVSDYELASFADGALQGWVIAWLFDFFKNKQWGGRRKTSFLFKGIPLLLIGAMAFVDSDRLKQKMLRLMGDPQGTTSL